METNIDSLLTGSNLLMPVEPLGGVQYAASWGDGHINILLIILSTVTFTLILPRLFSILGYLVGGLFRQRMFDKIEENVALSRYLTEVTLASFLPFCLIISRYRLYNPQIISTLVPDEYFSLAIVSVFAAVMLLRAVLCRLMGIRLKIYNFIILSIFLVITGVVLPFFKVSESVTVFLLYIEIALFYIQHFCRKTIFLFNKCNLFDAIMYLCALEILPVAIVVTTAVLL